ncbi:ShlB/FhaC/HecB family hemolysin secretion/activation protein, partial [Brevundimonas nasdae]|uniref:ShlB/FhaC/HecB family hemolysin secretion/activation protein n=1 Tax=Brevundimonas nasdae TaxID=172043 RepID=UPI003F68F6B0
FRLLAADPAIRTINANLRPGGGPGEAALDLTVVPQNRYDVYGSFANDRSPAVGGERLAIGGFIRNLLAPADVLSAELGTTHGLKDGFAGYVTPFLSPRTTLSVRGSFNNAAVIDSALVPLNIKSRDRAGEIGITQKLIDEPLTPAAVSGNWIAARTLSAGISIAHRRSQSFLFGEPFSFSPGFVNGHSHYTAIRLNGDYISRSVRRVMAASLTVTGGLGGTHSDIPDVPTPKRNFIVLLAQLNGAQRLNQRGLELRARLTAQYANSVLYAGERLSVGGEQTVRGYRENLLLADRGIIASLELMQPLMLTQPRPGSRFAWGSFAISAFTEGAYVGNVDVPNPDKRGIYSVGSALSWTPSDALVARISYGAALVHVHPSGHRDLQDRGINFRITVRPLLLFQHSGPTKFRQSG